MLATAQLPYVPPISLTSKAGMRFERALSLATHLGPGTAFSLHSMFYMPYAKACEDRESDKAGPVQDDPFSSWPLFSLFLFGSRYLLPLHRHTLRASSARG